MASQASYRIKVALLLLSSVVTLAAVDIIYEALSTLNRLDAIEQERDQWQRAPEVINALNLHAGSVVADLGCGSGYFTLKLSSAVGVQGRVLAADLRKLSLAFLWIRTVLHGDRNVSIVHDTPDDPLLPERFDAVLVVNTYHELTQPKRVLEHVFGSLVPGGRLVIADRGPESKGADSGEFERQHHELASDLVEEQLIREHFEIMIRQEHFLQQPGEGPWWLIVAKKPDAY